MLEVSSHEAEQVRCARRSLCHRIKKAAPLRDANVGFNHRFGSEAMRCTILKPEHIARQVERVDLAAPVQSAPIGPHCARDDLVDVLRVLSFAENLCASTVPELATNDLLAGVRQPDDGHGSDAYEPGASSVLEEIKIRCTLAMPLPTQLTDGRTASGGSA